MSATPTLPSTPRLAIVAVSAANTNRDGTGTIVTVMAGAAAGTRIYEVASQWTVTSTAGMLRLYISTDTGSTWKLFDEIPIAVAVGSASVPESRVSRPYANLVLPTAAFLLGAATHNAEASTVTAMGADLT